MAQLPTNRTTGNTETEHVDDHNEVHTLHNVVDDFDSVAQLTTLAADDLVLVQDATDGSKKYIRFDDLAGLRFGRVLMSGVL